MKPEIAEAYRKSKEETPELKSWLELVDKKGHLKEKVIRDFIESEKGQFTPYQEQRINQHFEFCDKCRRAKEETLPLLQKAS